MTTVNNGEEKFSKSSKKSMACNPTPNPAQKLAQKSSGTTVNNGEEKF